MDDEHRPSHVGLGFGQVDIWDDLLSGMYNELHNDHVHSILEYYRIHGYMETEKDVDNMTELRFGNIINRGKLFRL